MGYSPSLRGLVGRVSSLTRPGGDAGMVGGFCCAPGPLCGPGRVGWWVHIAGDAAQTRYGKRLTTEQAKAQFVAYVEQGLKQEEALARIGRTESTYYQWRQTDVSFKRSVDMARALRHGGTQHPGTFEEFSREFLGQPLYNHQLQWLDILEGREPRNLHPSQIYEKGEPNFVLINCPPEHGKTTTLSVNYATYRLVLDPNVKIVHVSKTADMSKQFLYSIKQRLTHHRYSKLQQAFAPPGGWKSDAAKWAQDRIYLGTERDSPDKDPSVLAVGIATQIYGQRSDLIFVDDAVLLSNAHEYEKQVRWIQQEALTRLGPTGQLVVVGTRVDPTDLYSELRNPDRYPTGMSPWTYLSQPAVLESGENVEEWLTMWPKANVPWAGAVDIPDSEGLFPRWDGKYLAKRRGLLAPRTWALAYQQASIPEDSIFSQESVRKAINGQRQPGPMVKGAIGHRADGMEGLYVIGSMDPAMTGHTGVIVMAVDRHTKQRYVLQVINHPGATPKWVRDTIVHLTELFKINEWRIEKNAMQGFLSQDPLLQEQLGALGVRIVEHYTGKNKWDIDYGVASVAPVIEAGLMELPATHHVEAVKQLVEQLIVWAPETKGKTDLVMALWFADIRARELILANSPSRHQNSFMPNRFLSRRGKQQQMVVNINDLAMAMR